MIGMLGMLRTAHNLFQSRITAFDVTFGRNELGRQLTPSPSVDRYLVGVIQPAGPEQVKLLPEGAEADGAQLLQTYGIVHLANVTDTSTQQRQTYVRHAGEVWKAWSVEDWSIHTGHRNYILTKYRDVDGYVI